MTHKLRLTIILLPLVSLLFFTASPISVSAVTNPFTRQLEQEVEPGLLQAGAGRIVPGSGTRLSPVIYVLQWVRILLSFLGIATVGGLVYGGFLWMTAGGSSDQVEKAKKLLRNMIIGLIIVLSAFSISWYATQQIQRSTGTGRGFLIGG